MSAYGNKRSSPTPSTTPTIRSGSGAPGTTPGKVGDLYVDTTGKKLYVATGTTNSSDWTITN